MRSKQVDVSWAPSPVTALQQLVLILLAKFASVEIQRVGIDTCVCAVTGRSSETGQLLDRQRLPEGSRGGGPGGTGGPR